MRRQGKERERERRNLKEDKSRGVPLTGIKVWVIPLQWLTSQPVGQITPRLFQ
jgi:hypothetical protein